MICLDPQLAWQSAKPHPDTGKRYPVFSRHMAMVDLPKMRLPCGKCLNCVAKKKRKKGVRLLHESMLDGYSSFMTLTYKNAPSEIIPRDFQLFMKRLRKWYEPSGKRLAYSVVGEYGDETGRPHFHLALFGNDFKEGSQKWDSQSWVNPRVDDIWGHGMVNIAKLEAGSAMYIAGYVMKKVHSKNTGTNPDYWHAESKRPSPGKMFVKKFYSDITNVGSVVMPDGRLGPVPDLYMKWFPEEFSEFKAKRLEHALEGRYIPEKERLKNAQDIAANLQARLNLKKRRKL